MQQREEEINEKEMSDEDPQIINIDEKWIRKEPFLKHELITCMVCYCIPLDYPRECEKCDRIFCHTDYEIISEGDNRCPNCKSEPWEVKKNIHLTYKHMFDSLKLTCILCPEEKEYHTKELITHLENQHNRFLSDESILFDYSYINDKDREVKMNLTQNIEINFKRNEGLSKFEIAGTAGRVLNVDLKEMSATHQLFGKCKIIKRISKSIKKNHQYFMWIVNISDPDENEERIVFYSEQLQAVIQKNYQDFQRNERLNQFCLDVRETRYRISFCSRTQTNTYTKAEKTIIRLPVIFR